MVEVVPDDAPAPRLCHLIKWPDFDGYGFNLHAERSNPGQFIGKIDADSPAQLAGLREGDRIVEVNGVNIANENHRQVVERIKSDPNEARLLVVDPEADVWYRDNDIVVRSALINVVYMRTPVPRPRSNGATRGEPPAYEQGERQHEQQQQHQNDSGADSIEPPPMSPDSGRGADETQQQQQQSANDDELLVRAEINRQVPAGQVSELSRRQKQLVEEEMRQKFEEKRLGSEPEARRQQQKLADSGGTKQDDEEEDDGGVQMQPDSLGDVDGTDAKEQARQQHNGSADSGKPTDTNSASSRASSIADSLEDTNNQEATQITKHQIGGNNQHGPSLTTTTTNDINKHSKTIINSDREEANKPTPTREEASDVALTSGDEKEQQLENDQASLDKDKTIKETETRMTQATNAGDAEKVPTQTQITTTNMAKPGADVATVTTKSPAIVQQQQQMNNNYSGLNLNMTASQMRELIASRKKFDPKKAQMNLRQKYEIIQQM